MGIPRRSYGAFPGTPPQGNFVYTFATACALSFVLIASGTGWAAGLGRFTATSALGQPFEAEIELIAVKDEKKPGLTASLASQQFFRQANIDYLPLLATFRASVEIRSDGRPYVRIVSSQPVTEPLLNLLVELSWASGRVMREYAVTLVPPTDNGLMHSVPSTGTAPAVVEEAQLFSGKTQDASGNERLGFPVAKGSANEEALKQTVTGKIAPAANRERIASLEKDIATRAPLLKQENPGQVETEMQEQAVTLTPGKAISPLAVVPHSTPSAPWAPAQSEINRREGARPVYEATDEPVAVAKSVQAASFSVSSPEPETVFLDLAHMMRPIMNRVMTNLDILGGTLALLIAGVVGTSIVRRSKKAGYPAGGNVISPMLDSSVGAAARVPSTVAKHETQAALFSGSSGGASSLSRSGSPTESHPAGIDSNKNVSSAYPYSYLRRRPLHEKRPRGREMLSQLDLARAYQEMGDRNAALQVLREVIRDGDAEQRERARRILANL